MQLFVIILGLYHILVGLFAYIGNTERKTEIKKNHKFALVVAAHNEQNVIGEMVDSLKLIDYEKEDYDIFVIADNCTDATAKIAREHGADVHERSNNKEKGKGYALNWMFERIFEMEKKYDAICVFDADNIVHKDFLKEINKDISNGTVNTVCLFADKEYQFISSTVVKEVFGLGKDISKYVDSLVEEKMLAKRLGSNGNN